MSEASNRWRGLIMDVSNVESEEAARRIRDLSIPNCLTDRPLVMGDTEQVKALHNLERRAEKIIENIKENEGWYDADDDEDSDDDCRNY